MYYLKVALITLVVTVGFAEFFGPRLGFQSYLFPLLEPYLGTPAVIPQRETTPSGVATLELTSEKDKKPASASVEATAEQAYEICYSNIKAISLFPEFTRIPEVKPDEKEKQYRFFWSKANSIRTLNTKGAEIALAAECHVQRANGFVSLFSIDKRVLAQGLASDNVLGNWAVQRTVSNIDRSTNVSVSINAATEILIGNQSVTPVLDIQCNENKTTFQVKANTVIGSGNVNVNLDLDGRDSINSRWVFTDDQLAITPTGQYIGTLQLLMKAGMMNVSFQTIDEQIITIPFRVNQLPAAIFPLQQACHWK